MRARATDLDERLKTLEKAVISLQEENKELKSQLGWDGKAPLVVAKPGGKESKITIGGLVHGQAEFGGTPDARFSGIEDRALLRRARVSPRPRQPASMSAEVSWKTSISKSKRTSVPTR